MIYKAKSKKRPTYKGLDCSGPSVVLPPTFMGLQDLVKRAGGVEAAGALYPDNNKDFEGEDTVREFLQELEFSDKAERQELIREFADYVSGLELPRESHEFQESQDLQESQDSVKS